ncbi:hypothetical protein AB0B48_04430 [Micromonospora sp. NPDC049089]|uniref:hypothetical protein n=1 Tax=Micromonospora sp. NPDC049089 TaxID=3155496 RepID=UPI0033CD4C19
MGERVGGWVWINFGLICGWRWRLDPLIAGPGYPFCIGSARDGSATTHAVVEKARHLLDGVEE